ncbi:hypothetical protein BOTBODRAFT_38932 [Botryobasidium botryosum FD-172 SS1]|uniref:Enoyl reductase (ER) domain-containing protein n=1 Tax=Botryobasidium botryosum (strain FD-172 SS1) TaxID=930990 RepID=A0A067LYA8_BOTB1|nr:hypothetical protein BOTBODRAFT_38932 [Botryobasidium botryosum FD-172 SS1]
MAPTPNPRILYTAIPQSLPVFGEHITFDESATIDLDTAELNGGVLLKTLAFSADPYLRGRMRDPSVQSYTPAFVPGEPIVNHTIATVLRSEREGFKAGDHVVGLLPWAAYSIVPPDARIKPVSNEAGVPWSYYVGILGMPGQTAYFGLKRLVELKAGQTIFVSAGSGAVGNVVCQLAKLEGLKVISSAGSDEKVAYLKEIGVDHAFNYKTADTNAELQKAGPVDIYWENVGGPTLDAALANMNRFGTILVCGMIHDYNSRGDPYPIKNFGAILSKSLTVKGFLVNNLIAAEKEGTAVFDREMGKLVADGKIQYKEHRYTGIENGAKAFLDLFKGDNFGKAVVIVADQ